MLTRAKLAIGLVPQEINLNIFEECEQILITQAGYYGIPAATAKIRAQELLKQMGLWQKRHTVTRFLSGGMKRRLMIARALMHQPSLLLLDEPTAGVDIEIRHMMWQFLAEINAAGTTIILTTHYLEDAEQLCNQMAIINDGQIVENNSIKKILHTLNHQTFIFDTLEPINHLTEIEPFQISVLDTHELEIRVDNRFTLNDVFAKLNAHNIKILSMRNKTNRLEELYMDLVYHDKKAL